jgi:3'(2'), 5'-bisphosphate nucleotidase
MVDYVFAIHAAVNAGHRILQIYNTDFLVSEKVDESPVTSADLDANNIITSALSSSLLPILSEEGESVSYDERKSWDQFWLVDPLDGTKEFVKKNGEFTVNIALINKGVPVFGVVYAPVLNFLYIGCGGIGAYKIALTPKDVFSADMLNDKNRILRKTPEKFTIVASRSHHSPDTETFVNEMREKHGQVDFVCMGSSIKLCLVAEGAAHVYPRLAPTMEWDTAAGHAVCLAAGKRVYRHDNKEDLVYNKENLLNPFFVVE